MQRPVLICLGLLLAALVNLVVFLGIPMLTRVSAPNLDDGYENPVLLTQPSRPPPRTPQRPKPRQPREAESRDAPPDAPRELTQYRKASRSPKPKLEVEAPELSFALNARLAQGMPVNPPEVEAPPPPPTVASPLPGTGFELGQVDTVPKLLASVRPVYPYNARRKGIEGWVKVRFLVTEQGRVERLSVLEAEPKGVFEDAVLSAVRQWRFTPGRIKNQPVPTWVVAPLKFALSS